MNEIDFIPPAWHAEVRSRRLARSHGTWAAVLATAMGLWLWAHEVQMARAQEHLADSRERLAELRKSQAYFDELLARRADLSARRRLLQSLDDPASLVISAAELSALLPQGLAMTDLAFELTPSPVAPAPAREALPAAGTPAPRDAAGAVSDCRGYLLRVVGAARNNLFISAFTARLGSSPLFRDVITDVVRDGVFADRQVRHFEVHCSVLQQCGRTQP